MGKINVDDTGIFPIDDDKIRAAFAFQIPQAAADALHAGISHHIANTQNLKFHIHTPS